MPGAALEPRDVVIIPLFSSPVALDQLQKLIAADMQAVDQVIRDQLHSDVVLIRQVAEYIIGGGGKRLRPALVLRPAFRLGSRSLVA